ncbi:MAG: serine/threonine-protein kinase, partial [bacterium]
MADLTGKTISHYKILEKIGEGGMGVVYKASDTKLKRTVALKFLHPHIIDDKEKRARFFLEAQAAASLNHPNICTIYEIDETATDDRQIFIAMEYVEGRNLQQKIESGSFEINATLDIASQIAAGLCEAHSKGVIHRDIKSANIMVTDKGQVKIMDFGLAKLTNGIKITRDGKTLGTMAYISPEQARGGDVDYRTDIWSLGVILYEMITGQLPFKGESEVAMVVSVLNNEPKPFHFKSEDVPVELENIVLKCLEKDIEYRYRTTDQLLIDLKNFKFASDSGTDVIPQIIYRPKKLKVSKKAIRFALTTILIFTALTLIIYYALLYERIKEPRVVNVRPLTRTTAIFEAGAYISPKGNCVAYNSIESGNWDVWLLPISLGEKKNLTADYKGEDEWVGWSDDGNWIFFNSERNGGGLYKVSTYGGAPIRIIAFSPDDTSRWHTISPDGQS